MNKEFKDAVKYINEAKTPKQRNARKALMHPILYGSTVKLKDMLTLYKGKVKRNE